MTTTNGTTATTVRNEPSADGAQEALAPPSTTMTNLSTATTGQKQKGT